MEWGGGGAGGDGGVGGGGQTAVDRLWQHISASLNTLIMFTSEIITWAYLTSYKIFQTWNEQEGKHTGQYSDT